MVAFLFETWFWCKIVLGGVLCVPAGLMTLGYFGAGSAIGLWQSFTSQWPLLDLAGVKMFAVPSVFVVMAAAEFLAEMLRPRCQCGAMDKA